MKSKRWFAGLLTFALYATVITACVRSPMIPGEEDHIDEPGGDDSIAVAGILGSVRPATAQVPALQVRFIPTQEMAAFE